uniref:Tyrosine-protein phosphatase 69D n=2 Tax=Ascaris TaxID=6251 RepID=F1L7X1_ASCSU
MMPKMPAVRRYGPRSPHKFGSERIIFQSRFKAQLSKRSRRSRRDDSFATTSDTTKSLSETEAKRWHGKNDRYVEGGTITTEGKAAAVSTETKKAAVQEWVRNTLQKGVEGIIAEYDHVDKLPNNASLYGDRDNVKNRYRDIGCIDKTRVRLKDVDASLDYIHANYIRSTKRKKRFICTQAPLDITVEDFWHMVCQERSEYIVMLCGLVEDNSSVCAEYWPQKEGERLQFQDFEVRNAGTSKIECTENNEKFIVTKSRLHVNSRMGAHICSHLFWSQWADRRPPPSSEIIQRIGREVRRTRRPIIVHCSTGVGRAGTFVAIELLLETLMSGCKCDMPAFLSGLRQQRAMAVNSCMQYIGVYQKTMEYFKKRERIPASDRTKACAFITNCSNVFKSDLKDAMPSISQ